MAKGQMGAGTGGGLVTLPPTEKIDILSSKDVTEIYLDFYITFPGESAASAVRVSLRRDQAAQLLTNLTGLNPAIGFLSPGASPGPQTQQ
jgi:hypothetical protein